MTDRQWWEEQAPSETGVVGESEGGDQSDLVRREIDRVLSDVVRSKNLIVLTGLGTSLCVKDAGDNFKAPTMAALWQAVEHSYEEEEEGRPTWAEVREIVRHPDRNKDIEELLSRAKIAEFFEIGDAQEKIHRFIADAERIIRQEVDFLEPNEPLPFHESFLRRLARRSIRRERLKLFTTNYDLCFEHAAQRSGFIVIDGFTLSNPSTFDPMHFSYDVVRRGSEPDAPDFIENLFQLYKIHGSIDWEFDENASKINKSPQTEKPLLIYPRSTKYELAFAQPYLEMMSSFQSAIRQRDTGLLIIGFGFNDSHIAEPILAAIETNLALKVVMISPDVEEQSGANSHLSKIAGLIDRGDARLSMIGATFEEIVPIVPDITAMTDRERHIERVRAVRGG
ncbi:SIR2 family protein [Algihabitans albus]|uniref:SIR2 family protein n=1 Tax=Algihabitans albus TaxID=2164067 RepID=UPI0035D0AE7A